MATSKITSDAHSSWMAADEKFSYILLGLSAALLAYLGEKYVPEPLSLSQNTIELCALVSLCVACLLYTSPSPRDRQKSRMPSSA